MQDKLHCLPDAGAALAGIRMPAEKETRSPEKAREKIDFPIKTNEKPGR